MAGFEQRVLVQMSRNRAHIVCMITVLRLLGRNTDAVDWARVSIANDSAEFRLWAVGEESRLFYDQCFPVSVKVSTHRSRWT